MTQSSSPTAASFASLLVGLAAPKADSSAPKKISTNHSLNDSWNDDALADDVATLSYEQALRTHARFHPAPPTPPSSLAADSCPTTPAPASATAAASAGPAPLRVSQPTSLDERRKKASITIRLSHDECAQLRGRAAAAGLTVSAYLRSCVFEVEALRAEVKETVAQLRSAAEPQPAQRTVKPQHAASESGKTPFWSRLLASLFARPFSRPLARLAHRSPRVAHA